MGNSQLRTPVWLSRRLQEPKLRKYVRAFRSFEVASFLHVHDDQMNVAQETATWSRPIIRGVLRNLPTCKCSEVKRPYVLIVRFDERPKP